MSTSLILKPDKNNGPCCLSQKSDLNQETQFSPGSFSFLFLFFLKPLQHGFRRGRSCETQLIEFIDDLTSNLEEGQQTDILIMDLKKAFDKVHHSILILKLHHYSIREKVNNWIKNWLSDRKQAVEVEGEKPEPVSVDSGVPQGSVLGPGLFLYYINDLPSRLRSKVRPFADGTIAYLVIILPKDTETLQEDLNELATWEDR